MRKKAIEDLRRYFLEKVRDYKGDVPLIFDLPKDVLERILFNYFEDGSKTFSTEVEEVLTKINFRNVSFQDFDCRHFDFTGLYGVKLYPTLVFEKSIEDATLNGVYLFGGYNDVCIKRADFTGAEGLRCIDPQEIHGHDLSGCTLKGVAFVGSFKNAIIKGANFSGSYRATIDPQILADRNLGDCTFTDVDFNKHSFYGCTLIGTNFTGSKNAVINPQEVLHKSLYCAKLCDTEVFGSFENVYIVGTDFTGSKGAVIDPQGLRDKSLFGTKLCNVEFVGDFDGCSIESADFTGSKGAVIENPETCIIDSKTNFTDAKVTDLKAEKIEKDKIKRKIRDSIRKSTK